MVAPETNLVYMDPASVGLSADAFETAMAAQGVEVSAIGDRNRFCTHLDVDAEDIERALDAADRVLNA